MRRIIAFAPAVAPALVLGVGLVVGLGACSGSDTAADRRTTTTATPATPATSSTGTPTSTADPSNPSLPQPTSPRPPTTPGNRQAITGRFDGGPDATTTSNLLCISVTTADNRRYYFGTDGASTTLEEPTTNYVYLSRIVPDYTVVTSLDGDPKLVKTGDTVTISGVVESPDLFAPCGPADGAIAEAAVQRG